MEQSLDQLKDKKSLLAFSGGVDSTALFFLLLQENINFDIAIVNYQMRESSKDELLYAQELSSKYNKKCFIKKVKLKNSNFEHNARVERYKFFEDIISKHNYQNLITAHQLNDKLEWFLMQLTKGAGLVEILGYEKIEQRDNYKLIRPLINITKDELLEFLDREDIKYFIDSTNFEVKFKRNEFRRDYSDALIKKYKRGIIQSFNYMQEDKEQLFKLNIIQQIKKLTILKTSKYPKENIRAIDKIVKKMGYILSSKQKTEILKHRDIVISNSIAISIKEDKIYISPHEIYPMDKKFKEECRVKRIPSKIRAYLKKYSISPKELKSS